jgi:peptide/nickel transport system permease protein
MAAVETVTITRAKGKGRLGQWLENNESRLHDLRYSVKLFFKSPLAVLGLIIVLLFVIVAVIAPYITSYSDTYRNWNNMLKPPSAEHLFGTDNMGGDVLSRVIWGSRISLSVGLMVVISAFIVGSVLGSLSSYFGGIIDEIVMRVTDVFLAFPPLILAMVVCAALGRSLENMMLAMAITWWPTYARIVRGQSLVIREQKYIEAAKAIGGRDMHIIIKHMLPNSLSPLIVQASMDFGNVILTAAALSFIGFGAPPGTAEWGRMVSDGAAYMMSSPWIVMFTGFTILVVCLGFNLLGDGVRDIIDPKMRR